MVCTVSFLLILATTMAMFGLSGRRAAMIIPHILLMVSSFYCHIFCAAIDVLCYGSSPSFALIRRHSFLKGISRININVGCRNVTFFPLCNFYDWHFLRAYKNEEQIFYHRMLIKSYAEEKGVTSLNWTSWTCLIFFRINEKQWSSAVMGFPTELSFFIALGPFYFCWTSLFCSLQSEKGLFCYHQWGYL